MLPVSRICFSCKEEKPITDFYRSNARYYQRECKLCNKARKGAWHKTEQGKLSSTKTKLKTRFNITLEEYNKMVSDQQGVCSICKQSCSSGHKLSIDHDHISGKIRGLLCKLCNVALGNMRDSPKLLRLAAEYLENNK